MTLAGCAFRLYIYFRRGLSRFAFLSSFDENCVSMTLVVVFILATVIIITSTPRFKSIFKIHIDTQDTQRLQDSTSSLVQDLVMLN